MWARPLSPLTIQVAMVPLDLVSTHVPLTSHSTQLLKLPFFQNPVAVILIVDLAHVRIVRNGGRGRMHETS